MREFPEYYSGGSPDFSNAEAMPGIKEVLPMLHSTYELYVASNWSGPFADRLPEALEQVKIRHYFRDVFTARDLGVTKPEPRFYREILKRINAQPHEVIMVGDDLLNDVIAAKQAGLFAVLYTTFSPYEMKEGGDAVIYSIQALPKIISDIAQKQK